MTIPDPPFWEPELSVLRAMMDDVGRAGAVLVGGPGSGKTSLIRAVLRDRPGPGPLVLQCGPALLEVPYGALSPLLTSLGKIRGPADVLAAVQRGLDDRAVPGANGTTGRPVIVVEDCQFLDAASAFVLAVLVQNREAVLLATSIGLRGESGLGSLMDTGLLDTLTMPALGAERIRALCAMLVTGIPTDGALSTILGMTGGCPRLLVAFLRSAVDQGLVVRAEADRWSSAAGELWTLLRPAPSLDERLVGVVESMHAELTEQQQLVVSMLAHTGRMPEAQVRVVAGAQAQDLAESRVTRSVGEGTVELAAEIYAETIRAITPPGLGAGLLAQWGASGGAARSPLPARGVTWAVDNGRTVTDEELLAAGYAHLAERDLDTAWYLADRLAETGVAHLSVLRAEVMLASARTPSGRAELVALADEEDGALLWDTLTALAMDRVWHGEDVTPTGALRSVWAELVQRAGGPHRPPVPPPGPPAEWWALLDSADDPDAAPQILDRSGELAEDPSTHPALRCMARWLRMRVLTRGGRLVAAAEEAALAYEETAREPRLTARLGGFAMVAAVGAHLMIGELATAEQMLVDQRRAPVRRRHAWAGTVGALQGFLDLLRGRVRPGRHALRGAALDLDRWDPMHVGPLVDVLLGLAGPPLAGEPTTGELVSVRAPADPRSGTAESWLLALPIAELVDELRGVAVPGGAPVWRRALTDAPSDAVAWQVLLVAAAARPPEGDHGELLAELHRLSARLDGAWVGRVREATDPAVASDWVRLAEVADRARTAGDLALAADTWARVVRIHDLGRDLRRRGEALRRLQEVVRALGGPPSRYVRAAVDLGALTPREQEIVDLVLAGHRSADVAEMLVVSPRTVEGHLYRVFNKLGISDRTELRDVAS